MMAVMDLGMSQFMVVRGSLRCDGSGQSGSGKCCGGGNGEGRPTGAVWTALAVMTTASRSCHGSDAALGEKFTQTFHGAVDARSVRRR